MAAMHSEYEFSSVAPADRRGFPSMLVVMVGFTFFSASMWAGATLGNGLSAGRFLLDRARFPGLHGTGRLTGPGHGRVSGRSGPHPG